MAILNLNTADGSVIGNPSAGNFFIFLDSNNSNLLTKRDSTGTDTTYNAGSSLINRITVNQGNAATTLGGTIDSTKEYFIDGVIDMSGITVEVPATGIFITGFDSEISQLVCTDNSYTMFDKPAVGGSGNVLIKDLAIDVSGTSSKVYDLEADTGNEAFEFSGVNYNNCTSLGKVNGYRQGLEENTGRFGGTPSLILSGTWLGGFRITSSIVRGVTNSFAGALFQEGVSFVMNSRFLTDINCDLGTNGSLLDFQPSNFATSSLLQLKDCIISRNGVIDATDTNLTPNISASDLESIWRNNQGLDNTYVGGIQTITSTSLTTISTVNTPVNLAGTYTTSDLQHFDSPSNGQLRNLGSSPREFQVIFYCVLDGGANDVYTVRLMKYDSSAASSSEIVSQQRQVNNLIGGADVTDYSILGNVVLDINDYVFVQVENNTDTTDCTALVGSFMSIKER